MNDKLSISDISKLNTKVRYYRLQAKAQRSAHILQRTISEDKINIVKEMLTHNIPTNRIACRMGITKEDVDTIKVLMIKPQ